MKQCKIYGEGFFYFFGNVDKLKIYYHYEKNNHSTIRLYLVDVNKIILKICKSLKKQKKEYFIEYSEKE